MIDHVSIGVTDLETSAAFYDAALGALGMRRYRELPVTIGYGYDRAIFWIRVSDKTTFSPGEGLHVALAAPSTDAVDAFYAAALAQGGRDAGPPGPRPEYTPDYYGAFVLDPTGTKVEAVYRGDTPLV
jgi:catechol 2,3-dioxygenase-like lactoylglutathione lyase family enzyme